MLAFTRSARLQFYGTGHSRRSTPTALYETPTRSNEKEREKGRKKEIPPTMKIAVGLF